MVDTASEKKSLPLIYHIITKLELGGAQRVTLDTIRQIDKARFKVGLISGSEGELVEDARKLENCTVRLIPQLVHPIRPLKDLNALWTIWRILRREKVSVVHTHSSKAGLLGRWAAFFAGIPVRIHSVHGWSFNDYQHRLKRKLFYLLERMTSPITSFFFLESEKHIKTGLEKKLLKKGRYMLLPPGIDFTEYDRARQRKNKNAALDKRINEIKKNNKIITMIACLKPQKAPLDFITAAEIVARRMKKVHFLLVGDGILRYDIEKRIQELSLNDHITLLGWRRDIPQILAATDILVLTSLWEGMPTALPIAMRLGVPVIANSVDGCAELIKDGINGLLSKPSSPQDTADNIIRLFEEPELYRKISKNSFEFTKSFEITKTTESHEKIYSSHINKTFEKPPNPSS